MTSFMASFNKLFSQNSKISYLVDKHRLLWEQATNDLQIVHHETFCSNM